MPAGMSLPRAESSTRSRKRVLSPVNEGSCIDVGVVRRNGGTKPRPGAPAPGTLSSPSRSEPSVNEADCSPCKVNVRLKHTTGHTVALEQRSACPSADARIRVIQVRAGQARPFRCVEWRTQRALDTCQRERSDADVGGKDGDVAGERLERSQPESLAFRGDDHG